MSHWLMVCSSTKALVYDITPNTIHKHAPLVKEFNHPKSKLKTGELTSDDSGRGMRQDGNRTKYEPAHDAHDMEQLHFAQDLAEFLDHERKANHYQELTLCAAPHFHGVLNECLDKHVAHLITQHIQKDYIPLPGDQLQAVVDGIFHKTV